MLHLNLSSSRLVCEDKTLALLFVAHLTSSAKISTQWKSFHVSCQWQPKFILNVFNTCPAIVPLNLPYFNSVWIHLEEKNTLPLWTSFWLERTDNENSSKTACPWLGSRTVLSCFSEVNFNVPNLTKSTVVVCLKISTLSTSYCILTCPTRGSVANNSSLFSDMFARQPRLV